ncbi:hypothetical protein GCM10020255_083260 [Rhodococcus baikonurensis]
MLTFGKTSDAHPAALAGSLSDVASITSGNLSADAVSSLALVAKSASPDRIEQGIAIDAGGLLPDLAHTNSWVQTVEEVDPIELRSSAL